jgi:hypothetical protein
MSIRISVTVLEQYRRMLQTEYTPEQSVVDQIRGVAVEMPWIVNAGKAWHKVLETAAWNGKPTVTIGEYVFSQMDVANARAYIGEGVWELKQTKTVDTAFGPATLVAQTDHLRGRMITDVKTKFSAVDERDYEQSLQWKLYLYIHDATVFRYVLCSFNDPKEDGILELREISQFRFWPYVGMEKDCMEWVSQFLEWVESRGLMKYLDREGTT